MRRRIKWRDDYIKRSDEEISCCYASYRTYDLVVDNIIKWLENKKDGLSKEETLSLLMKLTIGRDVAREYDERYPKKTKEEDISEKPKESQT